MRLVVFGIAAWIVQCLPALADSPHTPKSGSTERAAICDAARAHVLNKYVRRPLPQSIVFKIDHILVAGDYANFEAIPLFQNGSYIGPEYVDDIAFNFCFEKNGGRWRVIADLSRTDVPDPDERRALRRQLPPNFPLSVLSPTWRRLLQSN